MVESAPSLDDYLREAKEIRHALHRHPELSGEESATSKLVIDRLQAWGYELETAVGGLGVVATLKHGNGKRIIGIRADMDALPIHEETNLSYSSQVPGKMHACGHDGHTAILLAAARYLADTRAFSGTLRLIFQPAEETCIGAKRMIADSIFTRFPCDVIFGLHNLPGLQTGHFGFADGAVMAAVDTVHVRLLGEGGHGARPHETKDPIVAAGALIMSLQTIVSRNVDPSETSVVTIGSIHAGSAS